MSNPDILGRADKVLRPVLKELHRFPWLRVEGCCAGHKQEDNLWLEKGVYASNAQLVERAIDIITKLGGRALTPAEGRKKLSLKPRN